MLIQEAMANMPSDWYPMDYINKKYELFKVDPFSIEYNMVLQQVQGSYYTFIEDIYKIQNPLMYIKYFMKMHEYERRGPFDIKTLFHDTPRRNLQSIACFNFDWRFGSRFKYGPGVYFSSTASLANKHSCKDPNIHRSMFVVDVLVQKVQVATSDIFVPDFTYDTVSSLHHATYVKYFDSEYYPSYVVNYIKKDLNGYQLLNYIY